MPNMMDDVSIAMGPRTLAMEYSHGKVAAVLVGRDGSAQLRHACSAGEGCEHMVVLSDAAGRYLHVRGLEPAGGDLTPAEIEALWLDKDLTPEIRGEIGAFTSLTIGRVAKPAETWDEYLRSQEVSDEMIERVSEFRDKYAVSDVRAPRTMFHGQEPVQTSVAAILAGASLLFKGPKATGKTLLAEQIAWVFGRPLVELPGNVDIQRGDLTGERTLELQDGQPIVAFELGLLAQAMQDGAFLLGDELNVIRPEVLTLLHPVLDGRNRISIAGYGTIEAHPSFRFLATMNHGYMGTQETNEATADRMLALRLEEAPVAAILERETGLDKAIATKLQTLFETLQAKLAQGILLDSRAVTLRGLLQAAKLMVIGVPVHAAVLAGVVDKVDDEESRQLVYDTAVQVGLLRDVG